MFYGFVITESGNALLASMVAGQTLTITKAVVGEGTADNPDTARKLTNLITPGPTATSTKPTVDGNSVNMIVEYRSDLNGGLQEGFWIGEFGIFGKVEDGEETMIGYGSLGDARQYVSAYVEGTAPDVRRYPVSITVTTGTKVEVSYPAEAWMTAEDVDDKVNKHNSSEESHKDIRAALSNKAALYLGEVGLDLLQWAAAQTSSGGFVVPPDGAQINNPAPGNWLWGKIEKPAPNRTIVRVIVDTTGIEYVNHVINDAWFGWRQYATATQPQEYDLPLADGWVGSIRYSKTQEGLVSLIVSIGKAAAIGVGTFQVGTLPSGYYPRNEVSCAAVNSMGSTLHTASRLVVNPSGGILLQQTDETASGIFASITFAS